MTITRETIKNLIEFNSEGGNCQANAEEWEVNELARMALAAITAEPVYQVCKEAGVWVDIDAQDVDSLRFNGEQIRKVYTAPPAPVAPDCFINAVSALESLHRNGQKQCWNERYTTDMAYASGVIRSCRAAMRGKADQVIPDGYVMVPAEMTPEMMRAVQLRSELGAYAASNVSGAYNLFGEFWSVAVSASLKKGEII